MVHIVDRSWNAKSDVHAMTMWSSLFQLVLVMPFIWLVRPVALEVGALMLALGALSAFARTRWYVALVHSGDSLSRLVPLTHTSSLIVLVLAAVQLGEALSPAAAAGGTLMIVGAIFISMEQPSATFKEFIALNMSLLLVLFLALARAVNNVGYKWILNQGPYDFLTVYFYLKLFEFLAIGVIVGGSTKLRAKLSRIEHVGAFFVARVLQTVSGLLFIYVLNHMEISLAEPISAVGPMFALAWEVLDRRYCIIARLGGSPPPEKQLSSSAWTIRLCGTMLLIVGFLLLQQGKM